MNNNFLSRNQYNNSFNDELSSDKITFPPDVFKSSDKLKEVDIHTNILQNISQKETQIYKLFQKNLGKHFLGVKPASLILFEKRLRQYFFSSNFLNSFFNKKSINFDEKINMGSLDFLTLSDKNTKNNIMNSINREKILSVSKNFSLKQSKDVIAQEFFKMKYLQKNAKRIAKILNNKKNKNAVIELKSEMRGFNFNDNNINKKSLELNKIKRRDSDDVVRNHSNNHLDLNINAFRKVLKHNSLDFKSKNNLMNLRIFEYSKKDKPKINKNYWLNTSNISPNKKNHREIISSIFSKRKNRNSLTEYQKFKRKKKFIKSRNSDISFYINKFHANTTRTYNINFTDRHTRKKKEKLFLLNIDRIKKLSKKFKVNINKNINGLNDYSKQCKSKLLRLLYANNIDKKIYIIKKENKTELNELKDILFDDIYHKTNNNEKEKLNTEKKENQDNKEKFSKTMDAISAKKYLDINGGNINKKVINLEIKELINKSNANLVQKGNIKKIREKCKENLRTIIKLRENIKYKKDKLIEEFNKLKSKK